MTEERGSVVKTGVPLNGRWSTVSFSSEPGPNVYQEVLYVHGGLSSVNVMMLGRDPVGTSCHHLSLRGAPILNSHVDQQVKETFLFTVLFVNIRLSAQHRSLNRPTSPFIFLVPTFNHCFFILFLHLPMCRDLPVFYFYKDRVHLQVVSHRSCLILKLLVSLSYW